MLIREAELAFDDGLNAITGETGAGKTILAQAIGLLLGTKGDAGAVGASGTEAYVEAEFDLPEGFLDDDDLAALAELAPGEARGTTARELLLAGVGVEHVELVGGSREPALLELARHRDQSLGCR